MARKIRADKLLVAKRYFSSREKSRQAIDAGLVYVNGTVLLKPDSLIDENSNIHVKEHKDYVSRGAIKLNKALDDFGIDVKGKIAIDVGASTGGFTQSLLERGAAKVAALDVGYGQLDWKIRTDSKVDIFERKNIRYFTSRELGYFVDLAVIDVSFISLSKVIEPVCGLFGEKPIEIIALAKPQFEAPKGSIGKGGIIKNKTMHKYILETLTEYAHKKGLHVKNITFSPIKGNKGNIEFFIHLSSVDKKAIDIKSAIEETVDKAHNLSKA